MQNTAFWIQLNLYLVPRPPFLDVNVRTKEGGKEETGS